MTDAVLALYRERLDRGELESDPAQLTAATHLNALACELAEWRTSRPRRLPVFRRGKTNGPPRGIYIHGAVGRGKTMLMDLFFEAVDHPLKRRVHFHEFMAEVHERIRRGRATTDGDPVPFVAAEVAGEAGLLCFDELQVNDIADAMILSRLFKELFERHVVVVATSNTAPERLYWNGLNRQLFLPFIELLSTHMAILELKSAKDFRLDKLQGRPLYFSPIDARARSEVEAHWQRLTGHHPASPIILDVKGRPLNVPLASMGVARFTFADLCGKPLGSLDYLHIAHAFHTVLVEDIPALSPSQRNEARRFINLIDTLYDHRVCLIVSAATEPDLIYAAGDGSDHFERTVSRLMEMRSEAYLAARGSAVRASRRADAP